MFKKLGKSEENNEKPSIFLTSPKDPMEELRSSVGPWTSPNKMQKSTFLQTLTAETTINEGVTIEGKLSFQSSLRIDGRFEGEITSDGIIHVGPSGFVRSNLTLKSAIIEGVVEGHIHVKENLELRSTAQVKGDITAKTIKVDEGATMTGIVTVIK